MFSNYVYNDTQTMTLGFSSIGTIEFLNKNGYSYALLLFLLHVLLFALPPGCF